MRVDRLEQAPRMQCAVCKEELSPFDAGEPLPIVYLHAALVQQHIPIPEPMDDTHRERCDFCTQHATATWTLRAMPFVQHKRPNEWASYMDDGEWACCETCLDLIRQGSWGAVTRRAERSLMPEAIRAGISRASATRQVRRMHRTFRENWDGKIPEEPEWSI